MTKSQKETLKNIKEAIPRFDYYGHPESYEIKEWDVNETDYGRVILHVETGRIGDEGTLGSIFCRKSRQIFIGRRGGCTAYVYDKRLKRIITLHGLFDCMNRGYE